MKPFKDFFLERSMNKHAILPGGFKPPHKGHFEALKYLINENDISTATVYIGKKERGGITAELSKAIWDTYSKYLPVPTEVILSKTSPINDLYELVENNPNTHYFVGAGEEDQERYNYINTHKDKYHNVTVISIPPQFNRISGTEIRNKLADRDISVFDFLPNTLSVADKNHIKQLFGYDDI